jgi:hypothetical protein
VADFQNTVILPTECYDLLQGDTGIWTTKADIPQGRGGAGYATTCAGGEGFGQAWKRVDMYDFETDTWMQLDDMTSGRHGTGLAVSCECGETQVHIGVGRPCQIGTCTDLNTTETLFPNGISAPCIAQNRRLTSV